MKYNIKEGLKSVNFWIATSIIFLSFIFLFNTSLRLSNLKAVTVSYADAFFYGGMLGNIIPNTIAPLIATIAAYNLIFRKNEDIGKKSYYEIMLSSGLLGGSVFIFSQLIFLGICSVFYPSAQIHFPGWGTFKIFYDYSISLYFFMFMLNSFFIGFLFSLLSFSIAYKNEHQFEGIIYPVIIYNFDLFFPFPNLGQIYFILPSENYDIAGKDINLLSHTVSLLLIAIITFIILFYKTKRYQTKLERQHE